MTARALALPLSALALAGCVTTVAPKRAPVTEGSEITFYPDACKKLGGVDGDVVFKGNGPLGDFANAPCITGSLTIEASSLSEVALSRLSEIGGDLIIRDNGQLTTVDLPQLRIVGGAVLLLNVPRLEQVALPELTVVGDHLMFGRHRDLDAALSEDSPGTALTQVDLPGLRAVGGAIVFRTNPRLAQFALPKLDFVGDGLLVEKNPKLTGFSLAPGARIIRTLTLDDNDALADLSGLAGRTTLQGDLQITSLEALTDFGPLAQLATIDGGLLLSDNPRLTNIDLPALTRVAGTIEVLGHQVIRGIAWGALTEVGGRLEISGNNSLAQLDLSALKTVGESLDLSANFGLATLTLPALTTIGSDLGFVDNPALGVLSAPQLATIGDNLVVKSNAGLTGFDLPALTTITGYVTLQDNAALAGLKGLGAVTKIGVKLFVRDNPKLPECAALGLRDQLTPERPMWGEDIGDNAEDGTCE